MSSQVVVSYNKFKHDLGAGADVASLQQQLLSLKVRRAFHAVDNSFFALFFDVRS